MSYLIVLGLFVLFIYYLTGKSRKDKNPTDTFLNKNSENYIKGYRDGFYDYKAGVVNVDIISLDDVSKDRVAEHNPSHANENIVTEDNAVLSEKHHLQNINMALYMACFLLVVAAALFMGESFSESVRFIGVWVVTLGFYFSGLLLHAKFPKLRMAATAFIGTGLALLPFTGVALNYFVLHDVTSSWLVTSIVGLVGYVFAALYLRSQTISYFVIAFMVSLFTSSVASLGVAFVWYFVVLILFGFSLTIVSKLFPRIIPKYFIEPIANTNTFIVPITLIATLFMSYRLSTSDYWLILGVCTLHYLVASLVETSAKKKMFTVFAVRALATLTILVMSYDFTASFFSVGLVLTVISVLQLLISSFYLPIKKTGDFCNEIWLWFGFVLQFFALLFVRGGASWPYFMIAQLMILIISAVGLSLYLKRSELSIFGSVAAIMIPLVWGIEIAVPVIDYQWISLIFANYLLVLLIGYNLVGNLSFRPVLKSVISINFVLFLMCMLLCTIGADSFWLSILWLIASFFTYVFVYLSKKPFVVIVANVILSIAATMALNASKVESIWVSAILAWALIAIFYLMSLIFKYYNEISYSRYFLGSAIVTGVLFGSIGSLAGSDGTKTISILASITALALMMHWDWNYRRTLVFDFGLIFVTLGLQRIVGMYIPDIEFLIYTHWWALTFALLSMFHYNDIKKKKTKVYMIIGLFFITFFGWLIAVSNMSGASGNTYNVIFVIEHLIMLMYGLVASVKLQRNWGVIAIILAMLLMVDNFNFILPAFVAVILIIFAIKSLSKQPTQPVE